MDKYNITVRKLLLNHRNGPMPGSNLREGIRIEIIKRWKQIKKCEICGYNKCAGALHLDHRNPAEKLFNVCGMSSSGRKPFTDHTGKTWKSDPIMLKGTSTWDLIKRELSKCRVLCANCHTEKTEREKETSKPTTKTGVRNFLLEKFRKR